MENINKLICFLLAIANYAKDIHYTCHGEAFYSKHLLADRVHEGIYDFIDSLKETYILGNNSKPLPSSEYFKKTIGLFPATLADKDSTNFANLKALIIKAIVLLESIKDVTRGEAALLDNIAQDLEQKLGLLNLQVKD